MPVSIDSEPVLIKASREEKNGWTWWFDHVTMVAAPPGFSAKEQSMSRFVAASIAMIAVGAAFGLAAERSDHRSCTMTVHRPTREDEERTGVLAKEQRIKKTLDELENAIISIEEDQIYLSRQVVVVGQNLVFHQNEHELATSKLQSALIAAEERLEVFCSQNNITMHRTKTLLGHSRFEFKTQSP
jgi:hypothetical protein